MNDLTVSEMMFYSTVKITALKRGAIIGTGTGFFISFCTEDENFFPSIVTNNHVVDGADEINIVCHIAEENRPSGKLANCRIAIHSGSCFPHPDQSVDLCAIAVGDIIKQAAQANTKILVPWIGLDLIPSDTDWQYFDAIEEVTMIGCPRGISDEVNNLPISRRGITASPLSQKYNGTEEFMVDMACFPGSSGSPVFIYNQNGYLNKRTNTFHMGDQRVILVGILYAGPVIDNNGILILGQLPKVITQSTMHLGNVIRSSALRAIEKEIRQFISHK